MSKVHYLKGLKIIIRVRLREARNEGDILVSEVWTLRRNGMA